VPTSLPEGRWKETFRRRLFAWFRRSARDLPWRRTRDPYSVWVSEIMLQQTQVATVIPYFERFLATFPTIESLAKAPESKVLRLWEGLGYYRRARQLHEAAKIIASEHGGVFPTELATVQSLPGIGRYTAGAILSIARDAREPILEANTIRLLSRLLAYRGDPRRSAGQQLLWTFAKALLPRRSTGVFNQALMELGSTICTPRDPRCAACPVESLCPTRTKGWQRLVPPPKSKKRYEQVSEAAVIVWRGDRVLVRRCADRERWAGLWDFPRFACRHRRGEACRREIAQKVASLTGVDVELGARLTTVKYGVTRFRITLVCYQAAYVKGPIQDGQARWIVPEELDELPLSVTGRQLSRLAQSNS
jgi:A/G-specific adenine glycosylase